MKKISYYVFIMVILIIVLPILILNYSGPVEDEKNKDIKEKVNEIKIDDNIQVYFHEDDIVQTIDFQEYLKGVVAAEMPALFEEEALKAQAIAARTYTLYKIQNSNEEQKKYHKGADICTNYAHCQAWKSNDYLKNLWGYFGYFKYFEKISKAVDQTKGYVIVYQGELINPLFHSTSGGKTENSEEVFSTMLPYLRSVESTGEEESPKFQDKVVISFDEFKDKLNQVAKGITLEKESIKGIEVRERSQGGRVKKILIGNKEFTGTELRNLFALNSTNFDIKFVDEKVLISTTGYGHGVGMSQFGANYIAKNGKNYEYILKHYYSGSDIVLFKDIKK